MSEGLFQDISLNIRDEQVFQASFTRVLIPFMWALPHDLIIFQWSHFLKSLLWGLGFQHMNFGRTQAFGPNEETDLSKVTPSLIYTECSVVLIWSQGLRNYRFLLVYTKGIAEFWKIQIKNCFIWGKIFLFCKKYQHFVCCIWIYKTQLPIHTPKYITEIQIIPLQLHQ